MKTGHAAMLTLAAWYLLIPPVLPNSPYPVVARNAPLSQWGIAHSFDSAAACEKERLSYSRNISNTADNPSEPIPPGANLGLCIENHDLRLNGR